jgi:hypothetical protein
MMKKFILFLLLAFFAFGGSYFVSRQQGNKGNLVQESQTRKEGESRFKPNPFPLQNRFFTIVLIGMNRTNPGATLEKTFSSLFSQNYENYRIIYIDDASEDGSYDLAADLICESSQARRVTTVKNEKEIGFLANLIRAVETCEEEEIVVVMNGGDCLSHEWVLQRLNSYYSDPDLWMACGQYCTPPYFDKGVWEFQPKVVRSEWTSSPHLKTFYAGLFKKIDRSDFLYRGKYLTAFSEAAFMIPLFEMAGDHFRAIPEVLSIQAQEVFQRELSETDLEYERQCEQGVRGLRSYSPLALLFSYETEAAEEN